MNKIILSLLALVMASCSTLTPEDARFASTVVASSVIQYGSHNKPAAVATIKSAIAASDIISGGTVTPETFKAQLSLRLPKNETHDLMVTDLGALYTRFYPELPKAPQELTPWVEAIKLGLGDAIVPFSSP